MELRRNLLYGEFAVEDLDELTQFARQASMVVPDHLRAAIVLDAFDPRLVESLSSGQLGYIRYDETDYSYLICVQPPEPITASQQRANDELRAQVLADFVTPRADMAIALPVHREFVEAAQRRGGGKVSIDLWRLEVQIYLSETMASKLLAGQVIEPLAQDAVGIVSSPAGYRLMIPSLVGMRPVSYRRLH